MHQHRMILTIVMCLSAATPAMAQPAVSVPPGTGSEVSMETLFDNPPLIYRMLQIVHEVRPDQDTSQLARYLLDNGYGGMVTNVSFCDSYLESEEQWTRFRAMYDAARDAGLVYWIYDEKGYPSGKAGGLTLRDHPEFEVTGVLCARSEGRGVIRHEMPVGERIQGAPLRALAVPLLEGRHALDKAVDLTAQALAGKSSLEWTAPDGQWAILSFHVKRMYEGTHIVCNYSDSLPYINIMDREAVARFLEVTHEAYKFHCGDTFGPTVEAFFTDEPSLMTGYLKEDPGRLPAIPWSRAIAAEYQQSYGEDILNALPMLFVDAGHQTAHARLRFWSLAARLIEENFYGQIQDWCRANNIESSGHALLEESLQFHAVFEGDLYRALRRMDLPGIDNLSSNPTELVRAHCIPVPKFLSSVTHMIGKTWCMSESSSHVETVNKRPCSFEQRLGSINWQYALGLTRVTSYFGFNEFDDAQRRLFNDHIGRLGALLTGGEHVAPIGVYYPIESFWGCYTPTAEIAYRAPLGERAREVDASFSMVSRHLLWNQRDFDYLDGQAIKDAIVESGALAVAGERFQCVVLPRAWVIPVDVLRKLTAFVASGGSIVAVGGLPEMGMRPEETLEVQSLSAKLRASSRVVLCERDVDAPGAVARFMDADLSLDAPCGELSYVHRRKDDREIYFLMNNLDTAVTRRATFRSAGPAAIWHPSTGSRTAITGESDGVTTALDLTLQPFEGYFVIFG